MKIAFILLPNHEDACIMPPLPITYLGALLEQQRHIVRIYDLALHDGESSGDALGPLRAFRPHMVVVASNNGVALAPIKAAAEQIQARMLTLDLGLRNVTPGQAMARALWLLDKPATPSDEQSVIFEALLGLDDDLDALPFPARHLLPLEQYPLFTPMGDLQTTLLTGQQFGEDSYVPRSPALIISELRSIAREHGIRHFLFQGPLLTTDPTWLHDLLFHLATSDLGISWEGSIAYTQIATEQLRMFQRAGCEVLCVPLDAFEVLGSREARTKLLELVSLAHDLGMAVRAQIDLNPSYAAMPMLVDIAATFGLDDVRFNVTTSQRKTRYSAEARAELENITEMVESRYRSSVSRQFFIDRFGPHMGLLLWRFGRAGLLGRTWQRRADGNEDIARVLPRSASA